MTPKQAMQQAGLSEEEIARHEARDADGTAWDRDIVIRLIEDFENPENVASRATRAGPGVERATKMHAARVAWLASM